MFSCKFLFTVTAERSRRKTPHQVASPPVSNAGFTPPSQPPNSPTSSSNRLNNANSAKPSLVDLTDSSNNKDVDADLEKAIQLSLQEVKHTGIYHLGMCLKLQCLIMSVGGYNPNSPYSLL